MSTNNKEMTMNDPKKKTNPLADELRATIERVEKTHAEIFDGDKPASGSTFTGTRWSEALLNGSYYGGDQSTAREAVKGLWSACAREIGGCGGCGFNGHTEERVICSVCAGAGRILSAAGLEFLRVIASALSPQPKPDAMPEAMEAHNARVTEARRQRETAQRAQQERIAKERAIYGEAQKKLDELRNGQRDPLVELEHARSVHEAQKSREGA